MVCARHCRLLVPTISQWVAPSLAVPGVLFFSAAMTETPDRGDATRREQAGAMVMAARLALRKGQRNEARGKLQEALAVNPGDIGALEAVGDMLLEDGEHEKAVLLFERALALHPGHVPFEEKMALAHIDLDEMRRDRELREEILQSGEEPILTELRPQRAVGLSILLPGAGHFYIEEEERAYWFLGAWAGAFLGWYIPLQVGWNAVTYKKSYNADLLKLAAAAAAKLNGFWQLWLYLMIFAFVAVYVAAALDSWQGVERVKAARKQSLGI